MSVNLLEHATREDYFDAALAATYSQSTGIDSNGASLYKGKGFEIIRDTYDKETKMANLKQSVTVKYKGVNVLVGLEIYDGHNTTSRVKFPVYKGGEWRKEFEANFGKILEPIIQNRILS